MREAAFITVSVILLLGNLAAIGASGRERAKRAVCLANLRQLTSAWIAYANANDDKIVCGDSGEYTGMYTNPSLPFNKSHYREKPWVQKDWLSAMTRRQKEQAIIDGALYPYTGSVGLYRCLSVDRRVLQAYGTISPPVRIYSIVDSMNCKGWDQMGVEMIKRRMEIKDARSQAVFLDDGGTAPSALGGWTVYTNQWCWWDPPPLCHDDGTTFSFADGRADYRKWQDPRSVEFGNRVPPVAFSPTQEGNVDLIWASIAVWGQEANKLR